MSRAYSSFYFTSRELFATNSSLYAKLSIQHTTVTLLRRLRESVRRLRPELWWRKKWLLHPDTAQSHTSFFIRKFLTKNNMTVVPAHHTSMFSRVKIKLKGRHFVAVEVTEAESQVMLNTVTEHDFQSATMAGALKTMHTHGRGLLGVVVVTSRPKINFLQDGSTSPGNYGWIFVSVVN
jgi:hypothetical protein